MNRVPRIVAIDGAAGSGKSTLARALAKELRLPYVNTGLMYRALTYEALQQGVDLDDGDALAGLMGTLTFGLSADPPSQLSIEGSAPIAALEGPSVEAHVSQVARHPQVRSLMRDAQRRLGEDGAVMEGRDIGSVVFPEAPVKLYLSADPDVRAARRTGDRPEEPAVGDALHARDALDMAVNPFRPPPGAIVVDTTGRQIQATLDEALALIRRLAPALLP